MKRVSRILCGFVVLTVLSSAANAAMTLDLTTVGANGFIEDTYFVQVDANSTGTGLIESFVRMKSKESDTVEEGYNTDARPLEFDENNSHQFTRSLPLGLTPYVKIGEEWYREFLLDINQSAGLPTGLITLEVIEIYMNSIPNATGYPALGTLVYELDAVDDWMILLNYNLNTGSGSGDMFMYVPAGAFAGWGPDDYIYLYSEFGPTYPPNAGFEEWAVRSGVPLPVIPAPGAIVLGSLGAGLVGWLRRRHSL